MQEPVKHCRICDETKPLTEFAKSKASTNFRSSNTTHHGYCKSCNAARAREWRKARPGYRGSGLLKKVPKEDRLLMSAIRSRLSCAKRRSGGEVLSAEAAYEIFLKQERRCALTNVRITLEKGHPLCISLDQIIPGQGYTVDNVQWLAWSVNRAKGDLTTEQFIDMCKAVLQQKEQRLSKGTKR